MNQVPARALRLGVLLVLSSLLLVWSGCVPHRQPTTLERLARFGGPGSAIFQVEYSEPDEPLIPEVTAALQRAGRLVERWGGLRRGVRVVLHPTHEDLELAVGSPEYPWLRAWAQYEVIHLQSPRTWGIPYPQQLEELLAHELTHVAMYQAIGSPEDWARRPIPLWFREGMASVSAGQGYRRSCEAHLALRLRLEPWLDPFATGEQLLRMDKDLVYDSSHWVFSLLLVLRGSEEEGTARVRELLRLIREGSEFGQAFLEVFGMTEREFLRHWRQHIGAPAVEELGVRGSEIGNSRRISGEIAASAFL